MTLGQISKRVIADRIAWIQEMLSGIQELPLADEAAFHADARNIAAAESYLRRALEALFDLGRHVLVKGFGAGIGTYREIAAALHQHGVLDAATADLLAQLPGIATAWCIFTTWSQSKSCTGSARVSWTTSCAPLRR